MALVIDIQKAMAAVKAKKGANRAFDETVHPRDKRGEFSKKGSGERGATETVATATAKGSRAGKSNTVSGLVKPTTATPAKAGKKPAAKVTVMKTKPVTKPAAASSKSTTTQAPKVDKSGAKTQTKTAPDKTALEKMAAKDKKAVHGNKVKVNEKARAAAGVLAKDKQRTSVPQPTAADRKRSDTKAKQHAAEAKTFDAKAESQKNESIVKPEVGGYKSQKQYKPPIAGSEGQVTTVGKTAGNIDAQFKAGEDVGKIVRDNQAAAYSVAQQYARKYGFATRTASVNNPGGYYDDLVQSGRVAMWQTLENLRDGSEKMGAGASVGTHVFNRMKQAVKEEARKVANQIPLPRRHAAAMGHIEGERQKLATELGKEPSHDELFDRVKDHPHFSDLSMKGDEKWDSKQSKWLSRDIKDPKEKFSKLMQMNTRQKAVPLDKTSDSGGETGEDKELGVKDKVADPNANTEDKAVEQERGRALKEGVNKLMGAYKKFGLDDNEAKVLHHRYIANMQEGQAPRTVPEVAKHLGISESTAKRSQASAIQKLQQVATNPGHPGHKHLQELQDYLFRRSLLGFGFNMLFKALYEYDLLKSLESMSLTLDDMTQRYVRTASGENAQDINKSLSPFEYVGAYATTEDGQIHARVVEYDFPDAQTIVKAMKNNLQKSLLPHKGRSNAEVNDNMRKYVQANGKKYEGLSASQTASAKKSGGTSWSERLLIEHPGSAWITWGGKRILINAKTGDIAYDSENSTHTADIAAGKHTPGVKATEEEQQDFHHEQAEGHEDEGVKAYQAGADNLRKQWLGANAKGDTEGFYHEFRSAHAHKNNEGYGMMTPEQREAFNGADPETRAKLLGSAMYDNMSDENKQLLQKMMENPDDHLKTINDESDAEWGKSLSKIKGKKTFEGLKGILTNPTGATGEERDDEGNKIQKPEYYAGKNADLHGKMMGRFLAASKGKTPEERLELLKQEMGTSELSESKTQMGRSKPKMPIGTFEIANPETGRRMVVNMDETFEGGRGGRGRWGTKPVEAFDPVTGKHFTQESISWGQLGRELGYKDVKNFQDFLAKEGNTGHDKPLVRPMAEEEYGQHRAKSNVGMKERMAHKDLELIHADNDGNMTFQKTFDDGTAHVFRVNGKGKLSDPVLQRLIRPTEPIKNQKDLEKALAGAVGNHIWVNLHGGSDKHVGDMLTHHVKLKYDGQGAPVVEGGTYDGYRFVDSSQVPRGSVDPATGEPVKALFNNGKMIDRGYSKTEQVPMEMGNQVLYKAGSGYRKGKILAPSTDGKGVIVQHADGTQQVYSKGDLKAATREGRIQHQTSDGRSGHLVVDTGAERTYRASLNDFNLFATSAKNQRTQSGLQQAVEKAGGHIDDQGGVTMTGNQYDHMLKQIGRTNIGKAFGKHLVKSEVPNLTLHVPEHLRRAVEDSGVRVTKGGKATISTAKFEELRDVLGGASLTYKARNSLEQHFRRKDRDPDSPEYAAELQKQYQPGHIAPGTAAFSKMSPQEKRYATAFHGQFKEGSFMLDPENGGFYKTQLEGIDHLRRQKNAIAGHGMGTGKTNTGIGAILSDRAERMAKGEKPKRTLIVAPAGITSDWVKEFKKHTNLSTAVIGTNKKQFGQHTEGGEDLRTEGISGRDFYRKMGKHQAGEEGHDHDVHIMSYEHFMKNKDKLANSGMYDNTVIDEIHAFKNKGSSRGKSLAESTGKFDNVWGLSGTPMENDVREMHSLVDTVTGGKHSLGSKKEFEEKYMMKNRKTGKIEGVNPDRMEDLGKELSNFVQFRAGEDVKFNNGATVDFPELMKVGYDGKSDKGDPNTYYGAKVPSTEYHESDGGKLVPHIDPKDTTYHNWYGEYKKLHESLLPDDNSVQEALAKDGIGGGKKGKKNVLRAVQQLQQFANGGLHSRDIYRPGDAEEGFEQQVGKKTGSSSFKPYDPKTGEGNYVLNEHGMKQYLKADGKGSFAKNPDGSPALLPPLHHNNPRARQLKDEVNKYLDSLDAENAQRPAGQKLTPKVLVKSASTTYGTDIVENVMKEVAMERGLAKKGTDGWDYGLGSFTGQNANREEVKSAFRGEKRDAKTHSYLGNQGSMWASTVSPAGKEGVDFGNAHLMVHYDQDWNPQRMAQFTARVRRSDSKKTHDQTQWNRDIDTKGHEGHNVVRVLSLHQPGTVDDYLFKAQDRKIGDIQRVTEGTKTAEKLGNIGETQTSTQSTRGGSAMVQAPRKAPKPKASEVLPLDRLVQKQNYWHKQMRSAQKRMSEGRSTDSTVKTLQRAKAEHAKVLQKIQAHPDFSGKGQVAAAKAFRIYVVG